jgi:hypothetical protein
MPSSPKKVGRNATTRKYCHPATGLKAGDQNNMIGIVKIKQP